jgi:23S rRNA (guanosine2251-2'-O)-methyltransferase
VPRAQSGAGRAAQYVDLPGYVNRKTDGLPLPPDATVDPVRTGEINHCQTPSGSAKQRHTAKLGIAMAKRKPPGARQPRRGARSGDSGGDHPGGHRPASARLPQRPGALPPRRAGRPIGGGTLWLYGGHAVAAALANPARHCLRIVATDRKGADALLAALPQARRQSLAQLDIEPLDRAEIDALLPPGAVHQGLALLVAPLPERSVADICGVTQADPAARVVVLDQVTDPQNVGAVLRSAAAFGAAAVIVQDRNAPPPTGALAKAASGALEQVALVRAVNLNRALGELKDAGFWCLGLAGDAPRSLAAARPDGRVALVLGAEGAGLRRLTREACDTLAHIPISGRVESLNVSNAAAIALYELARQS